MDTERTCLTCFTHTPTGYLNDIPQHCWPCTSSERNGGPVLPAWRPITFMNTQKPGSIIPVTSIELKALAARAAYYSQAGPLNTQKGYMYAPVADDMPADPATSPLNTQVGGGHYKDTAVQPIVYIHANSLGFCEGNVVKYITRWRDKGGLQDLQKVKHYVDLLIELEGLK